MALDITLILVFAFFYVGIAFNHRELADKCEKWRLHSGDSAGEELNNMCRATRMLVLCALLATPLAAQNYAPDWQSLDSRPNRPATPYMLGQGLLKSGDCAGVIGRWRRVIEIRVEHFAAPEQRPWIDSLPFRGLEKRACGVA
jgi:hypothetical protein